MSTSLQWKVVAKLGRNVATPAEISTLAFTGAASPRIYLQLGLPLNHAYVPLGLSPTATYYQVLKNKLQDLGCAQEPKKPPFRISLPEIGESRLYVQARIYSPNIVALTLRLTIDSYLSLDSDFGALIRLRSLESNNILKSICTLTLGLIDSRDHRRPTEGIQFRTTPCFSLVSERNRREMPHLFETQSRNMVALLLGVKEPFAMSADLIQSALDLNKELNKKSSDERLLLNKQGLLYLTAHDAYGHSQAERFTRMSNLMEIGLVFQEFLGLLGPADFDTCPEFCRRVAS
jgi:hypothetical protein